jgi:uncharacterized protein (DUF488 family)
MDLFTLGHSNHSFVRILDLLARYAIEQVADVRSVPFSRRHPRFSRSNLVADLAARGIDYVFLGKELGARVADASLHRDGCVDYALLAASALFQSGLELLVAGARQRRTAILCAEREPLDCHRAILVARRLVASEIRVHHILADGTLESHPAAEDRLLELTKSVPLPLLGEAPEQRGAALERAYEIRGREIAWSPGATARR